MGPTPVLIEYLKTQIHGASIQEIAHDLDLNRNLVAKYLSILHMQGRLELRSYGNIKIYRLSNKIPFQSLSLLNEDIVLGIDKSLNIRHCHGCGEEIFGIKTEQILGKHLLDVSAHSTFSPELLHQIRSILDGSLNNTSEEEYNIKGLPVRIQLVSCIFDDGSTGAGLLCSQIRMRKERFIEYDRLLSRHTALLDEMHEFYVELSFDWQVVTINKVLCEYCGKPPEIFLGTRGIPLVSSEDQESILKSISKSRSLISDKFPVRVIKNDGSLCWQEWIFHTRKKGEEILGYHGYGWDISDKKSDESKIEMYQSGVESLLHQKTEDLREVTSQLRKEIDERRVLEKELKQREELYRNLTESTSDIVWEIDNEKKFVFVNGRVRSLLGYEPEEIIGNIPKDFLPPDEYEQVREAFESSQLNNIPVDSLRFRIIKKDETYAWLEITGVPVFKSDIFQGFRGIARDITTKIVAELQQKQLLSIIEYTPDLISMEDPDGNLIYLNRAGKEILGISEYTDITTLNKDLFIKPEYLENSNIGHITAQNQGSWMGDTVLISADGTDIPVSQVILSHQGMPGQMPIISTITRDISDRLKAEKELAHASAYNRTLIEVSPDPLVTIGPDGKITDVNKATEIATGYSRNQLIGTSFNSYFTEPDKADSGYQQVFSKGVVRDYPLDMINKDGHTISVLYNAVVYRDEQGRVQGVFAAARDVTEIKGYQDMISRSLSYYLNVLDKFPNPIWRSGVDGKCDYFNLSWLEFTGRSLEEELGDGWVSGVHPDDCDRCVSQYLKSFEKRESFCLMYRLHHNDGSYHWITDFGNPLFNHNGDFLGYVGSCYDIDKYLLDTGLSSVEENHNDAGFHTKISAGEKIRHGAQSPNTP